MGKPAENSLGDDFLLCVAIDCKLLDYYVTAFLAGVQQKAEAWQEPPMSVEFEQRA